MHCGSCDVGDADCEQWDAREELEGNWRRRESDDLCMGRRSVEWSLRVQVGEEGGAEEEETKDEGEDAEACNSVSA